MGGNVALRRPAIVGRHQMWWATKCGGALAVCCPGPRPLLNWATGTQDLLMGIK